MAEKSIHLIVIAMVYYVRTQRVHFNNIPDIPHNELIHELTNLQ